ncbi:hypothetical protein M430DRAFT_104042 [Amorphotheca resinae ATCC 22711]|uniref:SWR1-complex protein 3 domain-containing protein n=1 Tax=Amorphotheca resinae ATCC 22711 TaxID=857342 RepID=A0A2T3AZ37_AMORE|nr:hypothetical protein M430DRAFT_104042 [Amorphotheca resinae ATCC 22711]PSS15329.1 hypothetical protein M430DRAFT_104042 [Amorphotheca resinae ATCC 22711]
MERKRKLPARAARVESASKKRTSTPPEPRTQPTPPPAPPVVEETLPRSINAGKPLPTIAAPQPEDLSSKEYQSISESGVLVESLRRSRAKWLSEGIFEKYWTKPTAKNKGTPAMANNPPKDSMTKLGTCTITVEPHVFEAQMWAIKDPTPRAAMPPTTQQPMYRPIIQYGPPNGVMPPPPMPAPPPKQVPPVQPTYQPPPKPQDTPMKNSSSPVPAASAPPASHPPHLNGATPNSHAPTNMSPNAPPANAPAPPPAPLPAAPATKSTDPVIQMLAERAATDPDLKALMRIVANGEASPDELKKFQTHIDELTRLQRSRQSASQPPSQYQHPQPPPPPPASVNGKEAVPFCPNPAPNPSPIARAAPPTPAPPPAAAPRPEPQYQPQSQALRSKGPLPSTKPDISGVVFEFTGGSGDRFLFPKFSILEYLPQGQVIASFLIVRKGSSSDSPSYDPQLDYYQPITIRLIAHQPRQLDALQKVVAPPDEVRRYMDDIMDNMTRAEYVLLAMRLPREVEQVSAAKEKEKEVEKDKTIRMDNQILWTTTNPTPPVQMQPARKLLTEEEKYQTFISTIS